MRARRSTAVSSIAALLVSGCGARWVPFDAIVGPDASAAVDATITTDAIVRDVSMAPMRCTTNAECGAGEQCLTIFPGGLCTHPCRNDRDCSGDEICEPSGGLCLPRCTSGGRQCDPYGAACAFPDVADRSRGMCIPSCFPPGTMAPRGEPVCGAAIPCDPNTGSCSATTSTGGRVGDPCTTDRDCATGRCITEYNAMMQPTGFLDGLCMAVGRRPEMSIEGGRMPRENCPPGTVIFDDGTAQTGDAAACLKECVADSECRAGYRCQHRTAVGEAMNGVCLPIDCTESGRNCPADTRCTTNRYGQHVCAH